MSVITDALIALQMAGFSPGASVSLTTADQQAEGWRDDGTESGIIRTEPQRGNYVCMPFKKGFITLTLVGSVINQINSGSPLKNSDGTGTYLTVTVNSSATLANSAIAGLWFSGNVFGLRYTATSNPIGCIIDGVAYTVPATVNTDPRTGYSNGATPATIEEVIIANDLGPGKHYVELVFPASTSVTRSYEILGYVVDAQAGYVPPSGFVDLRATTQLITATTGAGAQSLAASLSTHNGNWGFRKLLFANISGGTASVYLVYSTAKTTIIWQKSIPAGDTQEFDFGGIYADTVNLLTYASATNAINVTPIAAGG